MKQIIWGSLLALAALTTTAQADYLTRWEAADEIIAKRFNYLLVKDQGTTPPPHQWTAERRSGTKCLIQELMQREGSDKTVRKIVRNLEDLASTANSHSVSRLGANQLAAATFRADIELSEIGALARKCNAML
ncbi:hypothetical protein [Pseudophaeobacter sp.]|uniref:hypothetical protein n=1 Tax=Pseudophaeobacter sp. TaxID=1971739 RepID=UPI004058927D